MVLISSGFFREATWGFQRAASGTIAAPDLRYGETLAANGQHPATRRLKNSNSPLRSFIFAGGSLELDGNFTFGAWSILSLD